MTEFVSLAIGNAALALKAAATGTSPDAAAPLLVHSHPLQEARAGDELSAADRAGFHKSADLSKFRHELCVPPSGKEAAIAASLVRYRVYADKRPPPERERIIQGWTPGDFTRIPFFSPKERMASRPIFTGLWPSKAM
jgi:hypothetical protein